MLIVEGDERQKYWKSCERAGEMELWMDMSSQEPRLIAM